MKTYKNYHTVETIAKHIEYSYNLRVSKYFQQCVFIACFPLHIFPLTSYLSCLVKTIKFCN